MDGIERYTPGAKRLNRLTRLQQQRLYKAGDPASFGESREHEHNSSRHVRGCAAARVDRSRHERRLRAAIRSGGCGPQSATGSQNGALRDTAIPYPIDRGASSAAAPETYKGLPLALTDNGSPIVTPVNGIIGLVCVGMSNGFRECTDFQHRVQTELASEVNPAVRVINCAVGGNAIERWNDPAFDSELWDRCITQQLSAAGVRLDQVRVIWHKAADQFTAGPGGALPPAYPSAGSDYETFTKNLTTFASRVRSKFPAVQAVYTSSRSYGGFANSGNRGEPLSYEEGHALNQWLENHRTVDGAWYGWGGYLWAPSCASGMTNGSGVCYDRDDFVEDGVHPSDRGEAKVSRILHARFSKESWYRARP